MGEIQKQKKLQWASKCTKQHVASVSFVSRAQRQAELKVHLAFIKKSDLVILPSSHCSRTSAEVLEPSS